MNKKRMAVNLIGVVLVLFLTIRLVINTYRLFTDSMYQLAMPYKVTQIITVLGYVTIVAFLIAGIFAKVTKFSIVGLLGVQVATIASFIIQIVLDRASFKYLQVGAIVTMVIDYVIVIAIAVVLLLFFFNKVNPIVTFGICFGGMVVYLVANLAYTLIVGSIGIKDLLLGYIGEVLFFGILYGLPILAVALERKEDEVNL